MTVMGAGYVLLIMATGKIPKDIQFTWMDEVAVETAMFRVIPFEFGEEGTENSRRVKCIHPDWFPRFDEIVRQPITG